MRNANTNANIQRFLTLGLLLFWWTLAWRHAPDQPWAAFVCFIAPASVTPALLAMQCIASCVFNRQDPTPKPGLSGWLAAWVREALAAWRVFSWWQPFFRTAIPDNTSPASGGKRGMVLVHGFFCNRALWTHWMRILQAQGHVFVAVDLEPAFGSIDDYAATVDAAVRQVTHATGLPPVVVGHSMGGLALRAWLAGSGSLDRVHKIITIGTPHHGTALARFGHGTNGRQMQRDSRWLAALEPQGPVQPCNKFVCFYSNCDNIVFPVSSATLVGADNRMVANRGHVDLIFATQVQTACWKALD